MDDTGAGSAAVPVAAADLVANAAPARTVVYFHHPVLSVGPRAARLGWSHWCILSQYGVDIVLTGHDHSYQRWTPLNAN